MICPIMSRPLLLANNSVEISWVYCQPDCMLRIRKPPTVAQETNRTEYACALGSARAGWLCSALENDE